jgi:hypothetical protein
MRVRLPSNSFADAVASNNLGINLLPNAVASEAVTPTAPPMPAANADTASADCVMPSFNPPLPAAAAATEDSPAANVRAGPSADDTLPLND